MLGSARRPIVLAPRRATGCVAPGVAPGLAELAIMLPYSPLHHRLMAAVGRPLVMTSGNLSDEPIAHTDSDAVDRLSPLVDGIVAHDRPIHIRCDDSVVRARDDWTQVLRRSRGYAPEPIRLPSPAPRPVLALGAELKSTVAVARDTMVVASHHLGDLEHLSTYRSFLQAVDHLRHLCGVTPELVAHDLHPEYLSTKLAAELDLPPVAVQHHHAHVASCLVDHGRTGPVLGVAFDGLGYGTDGTLWGGEFLVADLVGSERVGHLAPVVLPGGTAAIRQPWRMAVAWLAEACGSGVAADVGSRLDPRAGTLVRVLGGPRRSMPVTTSVGRLFDAVGAMVCGRTTVSYEGQAAIELEALAASVPPGGVDPYPVALTTSGGRAVMDPAPLVAAVVADLADGRPPPEVASAFHEGVAAATVMLATRLATARGMSHRRPHRRRVPERPPVNPRRGRAARPQARGTGAPHRSSQRRWDQHRASGSGRGARVPEGGPLARPVRGRTHRQRWETHPLGNAPIADAGRRGAARKAQCSNGRSPTVGGPT